MMYLLRKEGSLVIAEICRVERRLYSLPAPPKMSHLPKGWRGDKLGEAAAAGVQTLSL